ncbi:conserved hypothetical protein [uncultured Stenotrophomonas sp.]|uniref:Uncharacterized protein n=1 Tax=uncultured Stenotrophomonas sp. TaxID=165438 RepID=A0A1Y5PZJ1_9GAMM|nr:conserved hypothetical protein [uncultured Stenotrophomonas sp.]
MNGRLPVPHDGLLRCAGARAAQPMDDDPYPPPPRQAPFAGTCRPRQSFPSPPPTRGVTRA